MTSLPLILAEELAADWSKVIIVPAPPIDALYGNPGFGHVMHTASSASVTGFLSLRTFALQQNSTDYTATSRCKQDPLLAFNDQQCDGRLLWRSNPRPRSGENHAAVGLTQTCCRLQERVEDFRQIECRLMELAGDIRDGRGDASHRQLLKDIENANVLTGGCVFRSLPH